jgi:hypothetical protein
VDVATNAPVSIQVKLAEAGMGDMSGAYGAITHSLWAKGNLDIEQSAPGTHKVKQNKLILHPS